MSRHRAQTISKGVDVPVDAQMALLSYARLLKAGPMTRQFSTISVTFSANPCAGPSSVWAGNVLAASTLILFCWESFSVASIQPELP
jgi:hypothetical protein